MRWESVKSYSLRPHGLQPGRLLCLWNSPGKDTEVGSCSLFQGIFPTRGSNPSLLHHKRILYHLNHQGSSRILEWVAYPFSRGSSQPRNRTGVSCIAGELFTSWATRDTLLMVSLLENFIPPDQSWKLKEWLLVKYQASRFILYLVPSLFKMGLICSSFQKCRLTWVWKPVFHSCLVLCQWPFQVTWPLFACFLMCKTRMQILALPPSQSTCRNKIIPENG